ncbi:MAG: response regulator [Bdellovibrionales bacterium]
MSYVGKKVLVVDDEKDLCEIVSFELEDIGFSVKTAHNGSDAFTMVKDQGDFDLVISDVRMTGGDGIELLENIKKYDAKKPPVILMTGFADVTEDEVLEKGAIAIIAKPISFSELRSSIDKALATLR